MTMTPGCWRRMVSSASCRASGVTSSTGTPHTPMLPTATASERPVKE